MDFLLLLSSFCSRITRVVLVSILGLLFLSFAVPAIVLAIETNKDLSFNDSSGEIPKVRWSVSGFSFQPAIQVNSSTGELEYRTGVSGVWKVLRECVARYNYTYG